MLCYSRRHKNKNKPTITKISDKLWDMIRFHTYLREKPNNTIGRPVIPFRKVLDGIVYVLRTGCQWKMLPQNLVLVQHVIDDFSNGFRLDIFKKIWIILLKEYDNKKGIKWAWQSIDSISIKSPLGGP